MIKHIVIWKINQYGTEADRLETTRIFREKTAYLGSVIPQIRAATVGYNLNPDDVFHVCIDSVFESMEDLDRYINHPEHLKVREFMDSVSYDKAVFDYEF